jgi:DNA-binding transcriptional ArsR family regulator
MTLQIVPKDQLLSAAAKSSLPVFDESLSEEDRDRMIAQACEAADFLKTFGHEGRLMILCHLATGEKSVGELERLLAARQSAVSQQLTRLRLEGLVQPRREGQTIYYSLTDDKPRRIMELVYDMFCREAEQGETPSGTE